MTVLLSIKPEFAEKIFDGTKKFEFRKSIFKNTDVQTVIVYASSPVQQVIGEFTIDSIFVTFICHTLPIRKRHMPLRLGIPNDTQRHAA